MKIDICAKIDKCPKMNRCPKIDECPKIGVIFPLKITFKGIVKIIFHVHVLIVT